MKPTYENGNQPVRSTDVTIIGAGPIGIELAAALKRQGVNYLHLEARQIGYTISWWPRNTEFFSTTERIELAGVPIPNTRQSRTTGEEYLAYLRSLVEQLDLQIQTYEPVTKIETVEGGFLLHTRARGREFTYFSKKVVLATGNMHAPNLLDIPGEDLPHVSHYFTDPHLYFRKHLLIVGGRNSAAEAALRCWRAGSQVSISYRRADFDAQVIKHWILPDLKTQIELGNIGYYPLTVPVEITPEHVVLEHVESGARQEVPADFVLLATGFRADMSLFEMAGVRLLGDERAPEYNPETMETNVSGLYVAGTAAAGSQKSYTLFIENTHVHVGRIVQALTGRWPEKLGKIQSRQYDLSLEEIQAN